MSVCKIFCNVISDVERFVVKTLPKENLSTAAVHHKQCLILKIKDIRVKYGTQLNLQGELLQGTDDVDTITPKGGSPGEKGKNNIYFLANEGPVPAFE